MPNILIRICDALFCALLLRRAELVEVVELACKPALRAFFVGRSTTTNLDAINDLARSVVYMWRSFDLDSVPQRVQGPKAHCVQNP